MHIDNFCFILLLFYSSQFYFIKKCFSIKYWFQGSPVDFDQFEKQYFRNNTLLNIDLNLQPIFNLDQCFGQGMMPFWTYLCLS